MIEKFFDKGFIAPHNYSLKSGLSNVVLLEGRGIVGKLRRLNRFGLFASITLMVVALNPVTASAGGFTTTQLTNNSGAEMAPQIDGNNVVWVGNDGDDREIFFYNGSSTVQLTDNSYEDERPQVSGNNVVWWGNYQVFLYNGSSTSRLTNGREQNYSPQIDGNNVVWAGWLNMDVRIFLHNGSGATQLTDGFYGSGIGPQVSGNNIVWLGGSSNDHEIVYYNGSSARQLTYNRYDDENPRISGKNVVWERYDGHDYEIFFYDGSNITRLTYNGHDDRSPQISGNNVVWQGYDGHDWEIYLFDGSSIVQLTNNRLNDRAPQISGNNVVWRGHDGHDWEIYLYNGSRTVQLTNNEYWDSGPQVSGSNVVWRGSDGYDSEIFLARPSVLWTPDVSTNQSKRPEFTVRWKGSDSRNGDDSFTVRVSRDDRRTWHTLLSDTTATSHLFNGKMGHTYSFRVSTKDKAGNIKWSGIKKTIVPYNEGANILRRSGFNGYFKGSKSSYYLSSTRYSHKAGHTIVYKIPNAKSIGLITTKGPKRGIAAIYIDGQYVRMVDAYSSKNRPRQLIFSETFKKKKTHYIKIVNLGIAGRARFDIDGIAVGR